MNEPIIALATPALKSALAIIRVSGNGVFAITDSLFSKSISNIKTRQLVYGALKDGETILDEVVLLVYPGPNSMTGEDVVEISCHGSMVIVNQIIAAYLARGCRYATAGEFSARGFYNGKMDLIEAEAINDLINATTAEAKNVALLSLSGATSKLVLPLKERISALLALLEVGFDFPEYDEEEVITLPGVSSGCEEIRASIAGLIAQGEEGRIYREGIRLAIVGEPNVGKSSLLNALLDEDKAIVSDIPGTTRDVVEGEISIRGVPLRLFDTAGIRETEDVIEKIGVERSFKSIEQADLVVVLLDASKPQSEEETLLLEKTKGSKRILVYNKADLLKEKEEGKLYISAKTGDIEAIKDAIFSALSLSSDSYKTPSLSNARELALLRRIDAALAKAEEDAEAGFTLDIIAVSLQEAYNLVRELLGEEHTHDLTDEIFSRFCVGK